jgi:hypothetical protein
MIIIKVIEFAGKNTKGKILLGGGRKGREKGKSWRFGERRIERGRNVEGSGAQGQKWKNDFYLLI